MMGKRWRAVTTVVTGLVLSALILAETIGFPWTSPVNAFLGGQVLRPAPVMEPPGGR